MIDSFRGEFAFLSNFHPSPIKYRDLDFPTAEHAYQYEKNPMDPYARKIRMERNLLTPGMAKRIGRKIETSSTWGHNKIHFMFYIVLMKFQQNPALKKLLLATGDQELVEGNDWGDTFWGVCNGEGRNELGKILMDVRDILRAE